MCVRGETAPSYVSAALKGSGRKGSPTSLQPNDPHGLLLHESSGSRVVSFGLREIPRDLGVEPGEGRWDYIDKNAH